MSDDDVVVGLPKVERENTRTEGSVDVEYFGGYTCLDIPVDRVMLSATEVLESGLVVGVDKDGDLYFAGTHACPKEVLWLLEQAKLVLLGI